MTKFGQVIAYEESTRMATIRYARPDACEKCGACGGKTRQDVIRLKADCAKDDWVRVDLPDGRFLGATTAAYGIPLVCFLAGLGLGYALGGQNELIAFAGSLAGLGVGAALLYAAEKRVAGRPEWTPRVTAVYPQKPELCDLGCGGAS